MGNSQSKLQQNKDCYYDNNVDDDKDYGDDLNKLFSELNNMDQRAVNNLIVKVLKENYASISESDMKYVPLKYILSKSVSPTYIWNQLPAVYKSIYKDYGPCYQHYNLPSSRTHIDGPPPPKNKCCRKLSFNV